MSNKEKKLEIIKMITTIVKDRYKKDLAATADYEAEKVKQKVWDNQNHSQWDDVGSGFGPQPPNVTLYHSKHFAARAEFEKWESIYNYALENLVGED
jgi:hypothetical protein